VVYAKALGCLRFMCNNIQYYRVDNDHDKFKKEIISSILLSYLNLANECLEQGLKRVDVFLKKFTVFPYHGAFTWFYLEN
jgi:hypothetical protein